MSGEPWQPTAAHAASEITDDLDAARGVFGWPLVAGALLTLAIVAAAVAIARL